jgi:hypothetical protein
MTDIANSVPVEATAERPTQVREEVRIDTPGGELVAEELEPRIAPLLIAGAPPPPIPLPYPHTA